MPRPANNLSNTVTYLSTRNDCIAATPGLSELKKRKVAPHQNFQSSFTYRKNSDLVSYEMGKDSSPAPEFQKKHGIRLQISRIN